MSNVSVGALLSRIKETRWQWEPTHWKDVTRGMQLTAVADHHTEHVEKLSYIDPDGRKAWVKWLQSSPARIGFEIARYDISPDLSEQEYEERFRLVEKQFARVQMAISDIWGTCAFIGKQGDFGFPNDESADRLALWNSDDYRLLLQITHGGRETPIALLLYIAAPAK